MPPLASLEGVYETIGATPDEMFRVLDVSDNRPNDAVTLIERACSVKTTSRFFTLLVKILHAAKNRCAMCERFYDAVR